MKISILGTNYEIIYNSSDENENLKKCSGYCDPTSKRIYIMVPTEEERKKPGFIEDVKALQATVLRHEVIHAFLHESGLGHDSVQFNGAWATNEEMVDWMAVQFPKIQAVYSELGV